MSNRNDVLKEKEDSTKEVLNEIKNEYRKTADFLEDNISKQFNVAQELKDKLGNNDFDKNIEELRALKDEIKELKTEIKRLNEMENIGLTSLIVRDIKSVGHKLTNLQEKAVESIKHLYDNTKQQISYKLTKAQEKFVQMKIGIVKGLVNSMQDFIKVQQRKLDNCLEKLNALSQEIQKDEEKFEKDSLDKKEEPREQKKENAKENKSRETKTVKKQSVLKNLKENQNMIKQTEKVMGDKGVKKDKGISM